MKCSAPNCSNNTKTSTKAQGITFHLFPKEPNIRSAWIEALGLSECEPKDKSIVCSDHFNHQDFFRTNSGLRKIKSGSVPITMIQESIQDLEAPATMRVCRICLAMNTKMHHIKEHNLDQAFEQIVGMPLTDDDKLPQKVCWECAQRLINSCKLKSKALRAQRIMLDLLFTNNYLSVRAIKSINRSKNKLKSTLKSRIYEPNDYDIHIKDKQEFLRPDSVIDELKEEVDDIDSFNDIGDSLNDNDNNIDGFGTNIDRNGTNIDGIGTNFDGNGTVVEGIGTKSDAIRPVDADSNFDSVVVPMMVQVEIKDEQSNSEIFFDEVTDNFDDSEDDLKLSEVCEKKTQKRQKKEKKKKKLKLEKKAKAVKKVRKKEKDEETPKKEEEVEDPEATMDKYKVTDVKRRRTQDALDESLFTITTLTYEEQAQEVLQRKESTAYKGAPFKCNICFRGFLVRDRYDAHTVRHSEASGAFECFICKTRLKTGRALRKHLTAQHTEKFSCKGCPFVTRNRGVAREHEKWHAGTKYQCPHCPSEFDKLTTYMGHIRIKHVSDFVCELCGYTFVSKKGIDVHKKKKHRLAEKTVTLEGPYCEVCDVKFVNEEAYSRHMKLSSRHSSDNDPNRIRNDSQSMNADRNGRGIRKMERRPVVHPRDPNDKDRRHEPAGPVTCEQCGIQLRDLRLYAQHFRRAHPDKNRTKYPAMKTPCMCEQCGRIFQSMALLKDHMWVHTGEKRFKCDRCDKSFTQKTNLVFHMRVHSNSRPSYECPLCGKQFAFFNNRRRHMFIHTGLKPFKCDTCGKCFTTSGEQRAHVEHVHMKKPWPKRVRAQGPAMPPPPCPDLWQQKCNMPQMED